MKALNTNNIKLMNQNKVYSYIYEKRKVNKNMICNDLNMCLSTVNSNLKNLEQLGIIIRNGFFESTGGRKSDQIEINVNFKSSIGVAILKNKVHFVATNLYCETIYKSVIDIKYFDTEEYYIKLSSSLDDFIKSNDIENIIGVSIATQGIVLNNKVSYSKIMGNSNMSLETLQKYIKYDLHLEHDSKCAADLALWNYNITNGCVILLNKNLGSALIVNGKIIGGLSGTIEHYHLDNNNLCYCGKTGCLETVCSINSLETKSGLTIRDFFIKLRDNDSSCKNIWINFLDNLSLVINNVKYVIDGKFILCGELSSYLIESDINYLTSKIINLSPFKIDLDVINISDFGEFTQAIGASVHFIKKFILNT